jgi:hypothetical protein
MRAYAKKGLSVTIFVNLHFCHATFLKMAALTRTNCCSIKLPKLAKIADNNQGGQIGRSFAHWVTVYFGQFFLFQKNKKEFS